MTRKKRARAHAAAGASAQTVEAPRAEAFTFGDPVPVLDRRELLDYLECAQLGKWYEPPLSLDGLARSFRAAVHHSSPIYVKRNILVSSYRPHPWLPRSVFARWVLEYLIFGNGYLERRFNRLGKVMALDAPLAKFVRRGLDLDTYWFVPGYGQEHQFRKGDVFHLLEPDINQEIYGLPEYLSALNSTWLNESATLFRRKYYQNGSHAGFILYMTDPSHSDADVEALRQALKESKGPGNFRNLFMYAPNGKKDGMQIIPVSEIAAKDEYWNIKNVTRDDQLAAHRVPPQLMGIIPHNTGGFGDAAKAAEVFAMNEVVPLQQRLREVNEWLGEEVIRFDPYVLPSDPVPNPPIR